MQIGDNVFYISDKVIKQGTILDKRKVANLKTTRIYISFGNSQVARNDEDVYTSIEDARVNINKRRDW